MELNSISSGALTLNKQQKTGDAVGVQVLNKALNIQSQAATELLNSVPQPSKAGSTEPHLGQTINEMV